VTLLTWSQLFAKTPPPPQQLVPAWITVPLVFSALAYGLDRRRVRGL